MKESKEKRQEEQYGKRLQDIKFYEMTRSGNAKKYREMVSKEPLALKMAREERERNV